MARTNCLPLVGRLQVTLVSFGGGYEFGGGAGIWCKFITPTGSLRSPTSPQGGGRLREADARTKTPDHNEAEGLSDSEALAPAEPEQSEE